MADIVCITCQSTVSRSDFNEHVRSNCRTYRKSSPSMTVPRSNASRQPSPNPFNHVQSHAFAREQMDNRTATQPPSNGPQRVEIYAHHSNPSPNTDHQIIYIPEGLEITPSHQKI
ncbi:hypothetical protein SERLA73DRAFT_130819, partial [Serpula lacrymans var. lacrymans S7.3]